MLKGCTRTWVLASPRLFSISGRLKYVLATVAKTSEKFQPHILSCSHNVIMYPVSKILVIIDTGLVDLPYIPVYNAMYFLTYSRRKKAPRIIHRCRI